MDVQSSTKTNVKYLHLCYVVRASLLSTCSTKENRNTDLVNNTESDWKSLLMLNSMEVLICAHLRAVYLEIHSDLQRCGLLFIHPSCSVSSGHLIILFFSNIHQSSCERQR